MSQLHYKICSDKIFVCALYNGFNKPSFREYHILHITQSVHMLTAIKNRNFLFSYKNLNKKTFSNEFDYTAYIYKLQWQNTKRRDYFQQFLKNLLQHANSVPACNQRNYIWGHAVLMKGSMSSFLKIKTKNNCFARSGLCNVDAHASSRKYAIQTQVNVTCVHKFFEINSTLKRKTRVADP